jgi:hypothetical protein
VVVACVLEISAAVFERGTTEPQHNTKENFLSEKRRPG